MSNAEINLRDLKKWVDDGGAPYDTGVDDMAARAGYARHHLQRIFKAQFGVTMGRYLRARKLRHARYLIESFDINPADVSAEIGYACHQSFARAFKREFGYQPPPPKR